MAKGIEIPQVPAERQTARVQELLAIVERLAQRIQEQDERIGQLKDEAAVLKGEKKRPQFKPSRLDPSTDPKEAPTQGESSKRPGSAKRAKTAQWPIGEERIVAPSEPIPPGSRFKGDRGVAVQDLAIRSRTIGFRLALWLTPDGRFPIGRLPAALGRRHFGPTLASDVLYRHHHGHVAQPLLREQLGEWGVAISAGQLDAPLGAEKEIFHREKDALLAAGLPVSDAVTVDDTGARHRGRNGRTTHIGNDRFAWFASTAAKSRIDFPELLRAGHTDYRIDERAFASMRQQGLAQAIRRCLRVHPRRHFADRPQWEAHLETLGIRGERHRRLATEGALLASALHHGLAPDPVVVSDDAGQFDALQHGLCWVPAERPIHKLIPLNDAHRQDIAAVRSRVWSLYADLTAYKAHPGAEQKAALRARFEGIFTRKTRFATRDQTLKGIHRNRDEFLRVLDRPTIPLHTNGSETAIRDYAKKKKVSGGTRSDLGRQCRGTFASLKKTCRKLGISFWKYLHDRHSNIGDIPQLPDLIRQRASSP